MARKHARVSCSANHAWHLRGPLCWFTLQDAWGEIDRLHPPAAAPDGASGSEGSLEWRWMEVVWSRGLGHEHQQVRHACLLRFAVMCCALKYGCTMLALQWHAARSEAAQPQISCGMPPRARTALSVPFHFAKQVQRMVLPSFLGRHWDPARLAAVPAPFVLHTLLPAAGQALMWRGQGAAELQQGVAAWVGRYAAALAPKERRQLLLALLSLLAGGGSGGTRGSGAPAQQRPLVQTVVAALEAAAAQSQCQAGAAGAGAAGGSEEEEEAPQWQLLLLQRLQDASRQLSTAWGAGGPTGSFAASVCGSLLQLAASSGPLLPDSSGSRHAVVAAAAAWLQQLPLSLLLSGGPLHSQAVDWLGSSGREHLLPAFTACAEQYMGQGSGSSSGDGSRSSGGSSDGAGQPSWQQQADGLARLARLLAGSNGQGGGTAALSAADLSAAFGCWETTLSSLYRR